MYGPTLVGARTGAPPLDPEQERHYWILRGGWWWEAGADTDCVGATRAQIICAGVSK